MFSLQNGGILGAVSYSFSVKRYSRSYSIEPVMKEPTFDHEKLDVCRLSIDYVAFALQIPRTLSGTNRHAGDQWLRAAQSIPLNIAEGNGKQSLRDKNRFFEIARGLALECAAIHDILLNCEAIDTETNRRVNPI